MKVEKFSPSAALLPYVKEFMILETDLEIGSNVIPDTSIVMAFRYKGGVSRLEGDRKETIPAGVISGLRKSARLFCYSKGTANLLVVFNEGGISAFSKLPAHELFDLSISSDNLFHSAELNETLERLSEAGSNRDRIGVIESFLSKKLINGKPDLLVGNAVRVIRQEHGIIRVKDLASSLYISQDAFEKRFRTQVGSTPKQYASIIRLRDLINRHSSHLSLTEASYEAGYFDQSHFIKDFRLFTGRTPKDFFKFPKFW